MDRLTYAWTNGWTMFLFYTDAIDASENDDFHTDFALSIKALRTNRPTDRRTDRTSDGKTLL